MDEKKFGVAAKAIIRNGEGKYLVLFKSENEDINPNEIDIPGGRVEFGEEVEECLKREVKEEAGLDIEIERPSLVWGFVKDNLHLIGVTFIAQEKGGEIVLSGEHDMFRWMTKEEIMNGEYPKWIKKEFSALQ